MLDPGLELETLAQMRSLASLLEEKGQSSMGRHGIDYWGIYGGNATGRRQFGLVVLDAIIRMRGPLGVELTELEGGHRSRFHSRLTAAQAAAAT